MAELNAEIDNGLWEPIRSVADRVLLIRQLAQLHNEGGRPANSAQFTRQAPHAKSRLKSLRDLVLDPSFLDTIGTNNNFSRKGAVNDVALTNNERHQAALADYQESSSVALLSERLYMDSSSFANNPYSGCEVRLLTYIRSLAATPVPGVGP